MRSDCDGNLGLNASPCCACCGIVAGASYMEALPLYPMGIPYLLPAMIYLLRALRPYFMTPTHTCHDIHILSNPLLTHVNLIRVVHVALK